MKELRTLVVHPIDPSTEFLCEIYKDKDWSVVNDCSKSLLKQLIKDHDRIVMLGHGCPSGLFGHGGRLIINSEFVYLLRTKELVGIWCNCDQFFQKYNLKGFNTGMIISEYGEAAYFQIYNYTQKQIYEFNDQFAGAIKESIDLPNMRDRAVELFVGDSAIVEFNRDNLYQTKNIFYE